jgi:gas vesicle protein
VVVIERGGGSAMWWLLVGGAVGAGVALLLAPQTGEKARRLLRDGMVRLRETAEAALDEMSEAVVPEDSKQPDDAAKDDEIDEGESRRPGVSARRELEKRLAAVRARRQRALADEDEEPVA